jgi:choline dehydrogenase-like flavoprotein
MNIAIIGSGLAAVSAAKALIQLGFKPTVFDVGKTLDTEREHYTETMAQLSPADWTHEQRRYISNNDSLRNAVPQKHNFGSNYVYDTNHRGLTLQADGGLAPPTTFAYGGFSEAWGAAILPPHHGDIQDWSLGGDALTPYYAKALQGISVSAVADDLHADFPMDGSKFCPLTLTSGNARMLAKFRTALPAQSGRVVYGQARLLVDAAQCRYCGECMSGCVYHSIYTASADITRLRAAGNVSYQPGVFVDSVQDTEHGVHIRVFDHNKHEQTYQFDKVFIAAGAVNSTRIVMRSRQLIDQPTRLLTTNAFLMSFFAFKKQEFSWPDINTQPGIFLEYKSPHDEYKHWTHAQLSTPNDMIVRLLRYDAGHKLLRTFKRMALERLYVGLCNMHSDYSGHYRLSLRNDGSLQSQWCATKDNYQHAYKSAQHLSTLMRKAGYYSHARFMYKPKQHFGYHVGGSMPMRRQPAAPFDTDTLGRPQGMPHTHVIDSSVFPSLPGTTLGLAIMANAWRIATEAMETGERL